MRFRNSRGQGLIEYVILVALVAVATMSLVQVLQSTVNINLARVIHALQSKSGRAPGRFHEVHANDLNGKDFSNFWSGSHHRGGHDEE